jgi:uncharacterized protein YcsI (UPF0317 family)
MRQLKIVILIETVGDIVPNWEDFRSDWVTMMTGLKFRYRLPLIDQVLQTIKS